MSDIESCKDDIFDESHLHLLEEKTKNLSGFPNGNYLGNRITNYSVDNGECYAFGLFEDEDVSVALWKNEKWSVFPAHRHEEKEWLIVIRGKVLISLENNNSSVLQQSDSIIIQPNTVHELYFIDNTDIIGITIPKSKDFPEGGNLLW